MFIEPATVPAYLPPISMQEFQEQGIVRSFAKLATPIISIPSSGSSKRVEIHRNTAALKNPVTEISRRASVRFPRRRAILGEARPHRSEPNPPNSNGKIASRALAAGD